ncbi:MAG: AAA family ATPase [bacterium]
MHRGKNPFRFGEAVTGEYFANRKKEINDLIDSLNRGEHIFVYAHRRLGKSSLVTNALSIMNNQNAVIPIYVDLQRATSCAQFLEVYAMAISETMFALKERLEKIATFFKRIVPSFEIGGEGQWRIRFDFSKTSENIHSALEEIIDLPQVMAEEYSKKVVVVLDEFQEVEGLHGGGFEELLKPFIVKHSRVNYVFIASKIHIATRMFTDSRRPFYKMARLYPLPPIDPESMVEFIRERFETTSKSIPRHIAEQLVAVSQNIPYHIQMLACHLWQIAHKDITEQTLLFAIDLVIYHQGELYFSWYDSSSHHQRAVLRALAKTKEMFSQDTIIKYNLGSASSVQASLKALIRNGLVQKDKDGYRISDPFFERWLQRT